MFLCGVNSLTTVSELNTYNAVIGWFENACDSDTIESTGYG